MSSNSDIFADKKYILAPMAGYTDLPFRLMARKFGCRLAYTEMVSAKALLLNSKRTKNLLITNSGDTPLGAQIFGGDATAMSEAAKLIQSGGFYLIDINAGCPVRKIHRSGSGAMLLNNLPILQSILNKTRAAVQIPLTLKIRLGPSMTNLNFRETIKIAEGEGINAITIHARTTACGFRGTADWDHIKEATSLTKVPIIGNGDVKSIDEANERLAATGCISIMIGRAAIGRPWIFSCDPKISNSSFILSSILEHLDSSASFYGEKRGLINFRKHLMLYIKNIPGVREFRAKVFEIKSISELKESLIAFFNHSEAKSGT